MKSTLAVPGFPIAADEAGQLLRRDPLGLLKHTPIAEQVQRALEKTDFSAMPAEEAEVRVRDFARIVAQYVWTCMLKEAGTLPTEQAGVLQEIGRIGDELVKKILQTVTTYGPALSVQAERIDAFENTVTWRADRDINPLSSANFRHVQGELRERRKGKHVARAVLDNLAGSDFARAVPGIRALAAHVIQPDAMEQRLTRDLRANWKSHEVRMGYLRHKHLEYIHDIADGRAINEGPSTVHLLNRLHGELYGNPAYKVAGPALVGPPGWGKTSLLQDYFRTFGLEPLSADVDPGQSAFTLMASPSLGMEEEVHGKQRLLELIDKLDAESIKSLFAQNPDFFIKICGITKEQIDGLEREGTFAAVRDALRAPLRSAFNAELLKVYHGHAKKGYNYGLVLKGLEANRPVIINEFPELQEWTFIHGLLTAVPAADLDAAPEPTHAPQEGAAVKSPRGWFFNTITGAWMRVPEQFRVCFTGNVGAEYGNAGAPLALVSRLGSAIVHVGSLASAAENSTTTAAQPVKLEKSIDQEIAETIVWPHLCARDTGEFLLDDATAYKLHFLVTQVLPKMRAHLESAFKGKHFPISHRVLIDLCKCMNPEINRSPCSLDEALMRTLVEPTHALRFDSLEYIVSMLLGTGYLKESKDRLDQLIPGMGVGRFQVMVQEVKDPFVDTDYTEQQDRFSGKCTVCEVNRCPCHGEESQQYVKYLERTALLSKVGLDPHLVEQLIHWQEQLLERQEWPIFMEAYFGTKEEDASAMLTQKNRQHLHEYVCTIVAGDDMSPDTIATVANAVRKFLFARKDVPDLWLDKVRTHWEGRLQEMHKTLLAADAAEDNNKKKPKAKDEAKPSLPWNEVRTALRGLGEYFRLIAPDGTGKRKLGDATAHIIADILRRQSPVPADVAWLAQNLPHKGTDLEPQLQFEKTGQAEVWKGQSVQECRAKIMGAQSVTTSMARTKRKIPTEILRTPDFEQRYPQLLEGLYQLRCLVDLGTALPRDVQEMLHFVEVEMNKTTGQGQVPKAKMPYVRMIRAMAGIRKEAFDVEKAMAYFLQMDFPLPPMRSY